MKIAKTLLLGSTMFFLVSCGATFNPDWHVGDYLGEQLVSATGHTVPADTPEFNDYACMHTNKVIQLKNLFKRYNIKLERKGRKSNELTETTIASIDELMIVLSRQ